MKVNQYFLFVVVFLLGILFSHVMGKGLIEGAAAWNCEGKTLTDNCKELGKVFGKVNCGEYYQQDGRVCNYDVGFNFHHCKPDPNWTCG